MFWAVATIGGLWVIWCLLQLLLASYSASIFNRQLNPIYPDAKGTLTGRVAIFLAVRGSDPSFGDCLRSLLAQAHDDFEIYVIVDSKQDPAWAIVERLQSESSAGKLILRELPTPTMTCGLKCSALSYGVSLVDSEVRFFAFVDSDVVVHSTWLSELLAPLADKAIGVTTGNQWFEPESVELGSILRAVWHAGAIVPTIMYSNPWAGSLAMRREDFDSSKLAEHWRTSIVDDGPIREAFDSIGKRIELVSSVTLVNRESCSARFTARYMRRMLTWSKLYEDTYLRTVIHAMVTGALLLGTVVATLVCLFNSNGGVSESWSSVATGVIALGLGMALSFAGYMIVRRPITRLHASREMPLERLGVGRVLALLLAMPATQLLYAFSLLRALFTKRIRWRDATYELNSKTDVRLLDYEPYTRDNSQSSII